MCYTPEVSTVKGIEAELAAHSVHIPKVWPHQSGAQSSTTADVVRHRLCTGTTSVVLTDAKEV